jgi:hypothetical protein
VYLKPGEKTHRAFLFLEGEMNKRFLLGVIKASPDATRGGFARQYRITPSRLTELLKGYRAPTPMEREKLLKVFSPYKLRQFFPREPKVAIEGNEAINQ